MEITATEAQNNFGKYLKECRSENVIITKNGKRQAFLIGFSSLIEDSACEAAPFYGTSPRRNPDWITWSRFMELSENSEGRYELIDGEVYLLASPSIWHQKILGDMYITFSEYFKNIKDCDVFLSPLDVSLVREANRKEEDVLEFFTNIVQPDLSVLCNYQDEVDKKGRYNGTPRLVVEILSPSTRSKDMQKKLNLYSKSGISEYWIVDPKYGKLTVYRFREGDAIPEAVCNEGETAESVMFKGLKVNLTYSIK